MPNRKLEWNGNEFVHIDMTGEECEGDCIALVDDYPGLSRNQFTWTREVWESLAEHILFERDRRKEEAKQPKRWYVLAEWNDGVASTKVETAYSGEIQHPTTVRGYDDGTVAFYVLAKDEREAKLQANEAAHSLGVWIREYLA